MESVEEDENMHGVWEIMQHKPDIHVSFQLASDTLATQVAEFAFQFANSIQGAKLVSPEEDGGILSHLRRLNWT